MKFLILLAVVFSSTHALKQSFTKEDQQVLLSSSNIQQTHVQSSNVVPVVPAISAIHAPISKIESISSSQAIIPQSTVQTVHSSGIISEGSPQLYYPSIISAPIATQLYSAVKPLTTLDKLPLVSSVSIQSAPLVYQTPITSSWSYLYPQLSAPTVYDPSYVYQILRK